MKYVQHRTPLYPTPYYPLTRTRSRTALDHRDPVPPHASSQHHLLYTRDISHPGPTQTHPLSSPSPAAFSITHGLTPPCPIARSRPPPRPSDYQNRDQIKNQNQNRHSGEYTPTTITTSTRPPPWPILATPSPISSTPHSRPPPWPIKSSRITRILRTIKIPIPRTISYKYSKRTKFSSDSHLSLSTYLPPDIYLSPHTYNPHSL